MIAVDDGIASGNANLADIFFLVAVILFVIYALIGWAPRENVRDSRISSLLLGLGLACVAFAFLML